MLYNEAVESEAEVKMMENGGSVWIMTELYLMVILAE